MIAKEFRFVVVAVVATMLCRCSHDRGMKPRNEPEVNLINHRDSRAVFRVRVLIDECFSAVLLLFESFLFC